MIRHEQHYLALDLGATSGRAILGGFDGQRLKLREIHRFANQPIQHQGRTCWNWPFLEQQLQIAIQCAYCEQPHWLSLGCNTWGLDFGLLDEEGRLLGWPVSYQDPHLTKAAPPVMAYADSLELARRTAAPNVPISTLNQLLVLRKLAPETLRRAHHLLFMPDLINHHLTGQIATEPCIASTSGLLRAQDQTWDLELAERCGLPGGLLPPILATGARLGDLRSELTGQTSGAGRPVHLVAGHDTAGAFCAAPSGRPGDLILSSGTWSMLGVRIDHPHPTQDLVEQGGGAYRVPGNRWAFMRGIMGLWLFEQFRAGELTPPIATLIEMATAAPSVCIFNPADSVFTSGLPFRQALGQYALKTGQQIPEDQGSVVRAIFESLALFYALALESLEAVAGKPIQRIIVVGGGSKNRLLNQLTADATGRPVLTGLNEVTVAGNILVQAWGQGELSSVDEFAAVTANSYPMETFEPSRTAAWEDARGRFKALMHMETVNH